MGYRTSGANRLAAQSAVASSVIVINSDQGFVLTGPSVTEETKFETSVVTPGQAETTKPVAASVTITNVYVTDSEWNILDDGSINNATGGYAKMVGTGFVAGSSVFLNGSALTATIFSSTEIRIVVPPTTAGTYSLMLFTPEGNGAIYLNLNFSNAPSFTTSAGSIGTFYEYSSISSTVTANGDAPLSFSLFSGSLPPGASLSSNGVISGISSSTELPETYTFVIKVDDNELQDTTRTFSMTINPDVVTWDTPANSSTISLLQDVPMNNLTLSATSAAGKTVSYSAVDLPEGILLNNGVLSGTYTGTSNSANSILIATANQTFKTANSYISWSISLGDLFFKNVVSLLSPQIIKNPFTKDSSNNNFNITVNGDPRTSNFNPFSENYYSVNFAAKTDFVSVPATTALTTFTGDFTFEAWIYPSDTSITFWFFWDSRQTGSTSQPLVLGLAPLASPVTGQGRLRYFNGTNYYGTGIVNYNCWTHVAFVRSGTTLTFYVNGVAGGTETVSGTQTGSATTNPIYIGNKDNGLANYGTTGYLSNFRVVNGTALYTSNFTPSTSPFTAVANTVLLTAQSNKFVDNSNNNYTLSKNTTTYITSFDPYLPVSNYSNYGSTFFDGTGDFLSLASSSQFNVGENNFTVEGWYYFTAFPATSTNDNLFNFGSFNPYLYLWGPTGIILRSAQTTGDIINVSHGFLLNEWYHIALVKTGNTFVLYKNGSALANGTSSAIVSENKTLDIGGSGTTGFTGYLSNFRVVRGTSVYTENFTPSTVPLTAISNTALLTCQSNQPVDNNVFMDNSTGSTLITRNGNPIQGSFSPYGEKWSNYFDGTGDYLSAPNNAAFLFESGNFTVEFWFNTLQTTANATLVTREWGGNPYPGGWTIQLNGNSGSAMSIFWADFSTSTAFMVANTTAYRDGLWHHVAWVRNGTSFVLYLDGVSVATATSSTAFSTTGNTITIGNDLTFGSGARAYLGHISNLRIVKGTAVYTSEFTPPTQPLAAITNTVLLTCKDANIVDDSNNNFTITRTGDVAVQKFGPFASTTSYTPSLFGGSVYFDGTGDFLTLPSNSTQYSFGRSNFTIEMWVYVTSLAAIRTLYDTVNSADATGTGRFGLQLSTAGVIQLYSTTGTVLTSGGTVITNQWAHIAVTRSSGSTRIFLNGVQVNTTYSDTNNYVVGTTNRPVIGANGNNTGTNLMLGYISDLRVTNGTALYVSNFTPQTTPLTPVVNTTLLLSGDKAAIYDSSGMSDIETVGNTKLNLNVLKYGTSSMYFDGTGDSLFSPASSLFAFGTGDFTIEFWFYPLVINLTNNAILDTRTAGGSGSGLLIRLGDGGTSNPTYVYAVIGTTTIFQTGLVANEWQHIAVTRASSSCRVWINGIGGTAGTSSTLLSNGAFFVSRFVSAASGINGYLSDFRITRGVARYTSNFPPPSLLPSK